MVVGPEAVLNLQMATGIGGRDDVATSGFDIIDFSILEQLGLLGLSDVVHACAAAAPVGFLENLESNIGDTSEQLARLFHYLLPMMQMAGGMIGDLCRFRKRSRFFEFDAHEPLVYVLELRIPQMGPVFVLRIVGQEAAVVF